MLHIGDMQTSKCGINAKRNGLAGGGGTKTKPGALSALAAPYSGLREPWRTALHNTGPDDGRGFPQPPACTARRSYCHSRVDGVARDVC